MSHLPHHGLHLTGKDPSLALDKAGRELWLDHGLSVFAGFVALDNLFVPS